MKLMLVIAFLFAGTMSFANDAAMPVINVQGIDPGDSVQGATFKIYGKDTDSLFEMIPGWVSVNPDYDKESHKIYRELRIQSAGWFLNVTCMKKDYDGNPLPKGTECEFSLRQRTDESELESDSFDWAPSCSAD